MGEEMSTLGGAVATAGTAVATTLTFGQIDELNDAVEECAKFTADHAKKTIVRHVGETVGSATAAVGVGIAAGVTLGQVDSINELTVDLFENTGKSTINSAKAIGTTVNDALDSTPLIGHYKGCIHYALGDDKGGDNAMRSASRTTGVVIGGIAGIPGGPAGMIGGGIAGGAVADGIITGTESAINKKYTPSGQIAAWTNVVNSEDPQEVVGGVVNGLMSPIMDGFGGYGAGTAVKQFKSKLDSRSSNNSHLKNAVYETSETGATTNINSNFQGCAASELKWYDGTPLQEWHKKIMMENPNDFHIVNKNTVMPKLKGGGKGTGWGKNRKRGGRRQHKGSTGHGDIDRFKGMTEIDANNARKLRQNYKNNAKEWKNLPKDNPKHLQSLLNETDGRIKAQKIWEKYNRGDAGHAEQIVNRMKQTRKNILQTEQYSHSPQATKIVNNLENAAKVGTDLKDALQQRSNLQSKIQKYQQSINKFGYGYQR